MNCSSSLKNITHVHSVYFKNEFIKPQQLMPWSPCLGRQRRPTDIKVYSTKEGQDCLRVWWQIVIEDCTLYTVCLWLLRDFFTPTSVDTLFFFSLYSDTSLPYKIGSKTNTTIATNVPSSTALISYRLIPNLCSPVSPLMSLPRALFIRNVNFDFSHQGLNWAVSASSPYPR